MAKPEVVFIMGPTASGKTDLAMQLYDAMPCDLISVDSALVYREMDIGTAKPTKAELARYPHQLIDICLPDEPYSASRFRQDALGLIKQSLNEGRLPVLVGGTMLYYKTLLEGIADLPSADETLRAEISQEAAKKGWPQLHAELEEFDPQSAARLQPGDSQRIQRAIEVYRLTGKTLSDYYSEQASQRLDYSVLNIAISPIDRTILRQRIRERFLVMLEKGLVAEVKHLLKERNYDPDLPAMRSVGYRQVIEYLNGHYDEQMMIEKAVTATARLAKRQVTWLRSWPDVIWFDSNDDENLMKLTALL